MVVCCPVYLNYGNLAIMMICYDATEDEVIPYIDKTFQFIQDMEKLIVFKGE